MERKNVIFLTVVAIATLLVAVIGATFAFFSTQVQSNVTNGENKVDIGTAKLDSLPMIVFDVTGNKINMEKAFPGDSSNSSFTIKNNSDMDLSYNISCSNYPYPKKDDQSITCPAFSATSTIAAYSSGVRSWK